MKIGISLLLGVATLFSPHLQAADTSARALLDQAIEAEGGADSLRAIQNIQWRAQGCRNMLEQSERPEGPYIVEFLNVAEVHDYQHHRYWSNSASKIYPGFQFSSGSVVSDGFMMQTAGGRAVPGSRDAMQMIEERMALSPERLLLTALDAQDTRLEKDVLLESVLQQVIAFSLDGAPVKLYLNPYTHLPTAVDYSGPLARAGYWRYLGDVTMRIRYSMWWLVKGGIHLPLQWNIERNGLPDQMMVIEKLEIDAPLIEEDFRISAAVRAQFQNSKAKTDLNQLPLGRPNDPAKELAQGIVLIPGSWNTTLVDQGDGVVVIEAPISSGYSEKVIDEVHRRFPGKVVKAVITTSDSWPHLAGIREYVADGIPIYALDLNRPILERMIVMPYSANPDKLERSPKRPDLHLVSEKMIVGSGSNRLEIFPIRGETSERQAMVYFPEHRLLYGSDPFQKLQDGTYSFPQTVSELKEAVRREHLQVDTFFMMHIGSMPWADLGGVITSAAERDSPDGVLK